MEYGHNVLHGSRLLLVITLAFFSHSEAEMEVLTEGNWTAALEGQWFVEFYAPWCGACRSFEPIWQQFSEQRQPFDTKIAKVDTSTETGLAARFFVSQLPTLYHIKDGSEFRKYSGKRRIDNLEKFLADQEWKDIEPVVWYMKPNSLPMEAAGLLASIGEKMRLMINFLTDTYSIPMWAIVIALIAITILMGVFLGLSMVFIGGVFFPPKAKKPRVDTKKEAVVDQNTAANDSKKDK